MSDGTVMSFDRSNGFGFIQPEDGSKPLLIHIAVVRKAGHQTLMQGQKVAYDCCNGPYGSFTARNLSVR